MHSEWITKLGCAARKTGHFCLAAALLTGVSAGTAFAQDIGGHYNVFGTNPNGSNYSGTADIEVSGPACRIVWHTGSDLHGICLMAKTAFAAIYGSADGTALAVYDLGMDGRLQGVWRLPYGGRGTEVLIPAR